MGRDEPAHDRAEGSGDRRIAEDHHSSATRRADQLAQPQENGRTQQRPDGQSEHEATPAWWRCVDVCHDPPLDRGQKDTAFTGPGKRDRHVQDLINGLFESALDHLSKHARQAAGACTLRRERTNPDAAMRCNAMRACPPSSSSNVQAPSFQVLSDPLNDEQTFIPRGDERPGKDP